MRPFCASLSLPVRYRAKMFHVELIKKPLSFRFVVPQPRIS